MDTFGTRWRIMVFSMARQRRKHSQEFKAEVVRLVIDGGKSIAEVARAHDLADSLVSMWVRQARVDMGQGPAGALTSSEKEELAQLRKENRELREDREILKKAAAFFAKQHK